MAEESESLLAPFSFLSRRRFLKLGLTAGSLLLMGGAGGLLFLRGRAPAVEGLQVLNEQEYRTIGALARVHLPRGGPFGLGAEDFDPGRFVDGFLADEPPENVRDLQNGLFLLEFGPVLFDGRLATFSNLTDAERLVHWQSWMISRTLERRMLAFALRKLISFGFFTQPSVAPALGYHMKRIWS